MGGERRCDSRSPTPLDARVSAGARFLSTLTASVDRLSASLPTPLAVLRQHGRKARVCGSFALLAQLVEHFHGKEGVAGSSPAEGFLICRSFRTSRLVDSCD